MGLLDDLIGGLTGQTAEQTTSATLGILGFVFWLVVIIGTTFGIFILFRVLWLKYSYEGAQEIAPYRIIWMGRYSSLEGNLSVNDSFDEETMDGLEQQTNLKIIASIVKDQIKNNQLFVYNFKITDEGDIMESFSKKVRLISPYDLTLPRYTWLDSRGKRTIASILRREKRRNVICYSTTKKFTVFDEEGNEVDYFVVSPIPMVDAKIAIGFNGKPIHPTPTHYIDIIKIEGGRALAQVATLAPVLAESVRKYLNVRDERDNYARLYDDEVEMHQQTNMEKEQVKHELTQKIYVGDERKPIPPRSVMNAGWLVGTAFLVFFFMVVLPEYLITMELIVVQVLGMGAGLGIIMMLWAYYSEKQKTIQEKEMKGIR